LPNADEWKAVPGRAKSGSKDTRARGPQRRAGNGVLENKKGIQVSRRGLSRQS
jgi:hypothetical protein